ncbi:UNVERIFIED_CONTAM: peptide/nickel transport system ATP-binding protein [Brevibacillus sp. OAP136]
MNEPILQVNNLSISIDSPKGELPIIRGISFSVNRGEIVGIVGESGCGKSVTSLSIMGLLPMPPGRVKSGSILFQNLDLLQASENEMEKKRGNQLSMIFQEPMTSLNPVFCIGDQIDEVIMIHQKLPRKKARLMTLEMLKQVGIPDVQKVAKCFPHELSGGMRQRVMIAMSMSCRPQLLIADEPTTALDVTIQAQILELMRKLGEETGTAILFISHDLGVIAEMCQRVIIMYAGQIVEEGDVVSLFRNPKHPYTQGLLASIPQHHSKRGRLYSISGEVPQAGKLQQGCMFAPRCEHALPQCSVETPPLTRFNESHTGSCWLHTLEERRELHGEGAAGSA